MKNSKLKLSVALFIILLAGLGIGFFYLRQRGFQNQEPAESGKNRVVEEINTLPVEQRPFTRLYPRPDGRQVTIVVNQIPGYDLVEYELEYQAGSLLQGAFGELNFEKDKAPAERNILLGSCSAGGACSYHQDVSGGTLLLRYRDSDKVVLRAEWNFQKMSEEKGLFTSRDGKFTFDVGSNGLPASSYVIVSQSLGLPEPLGDEVVGGPYTVSLAKGISVAAGEIELTMRTVVEAVDVKLLGWTEDGWREYEAQVSGKNLKAVVDQAGTFAAIQTSSP